MTTPRPAPPTKELLRNIAAIVLGVIVGYVVIFVTDILNSALHPMPSGADPRSEAAMRSWMQALPASAFALILFGWTFGAFIGGAVAGKIERVTWQLNVLIVGGVLLISSVLSMRSLPHPTWMWIGAIVGIIPAAFVGGRIGATQR